MATYAELYDLNSNSALKNKITVATIIAAETVRGKDPGTTNHANRLVWAAAVFASPASEGERMFWAVIAANSGQSVANITGASDAAIQTNVNNAVDLFATG